MNRLASYLVALALGAASAFALVACGEEDADLLPGETAREIGENLDSVQRLADEGECEEADAAALEVSAQVESLRGIDEELKRALAKGAERLNEVVDRCEEPTETFEETIPPTTEATDEGEDDEEEEKEREKREKEEEKDLEAQEKEEEQALKEQEKEEEQAEKEAEEAAPPAEPPAEGGSPSGGIAPSEEADD